MGKVVPGRRVIREKSSWGQGLCPQVSIVQPFLHEKIVLLLGPLTHDGVSGLQCNRTQLSALAALPLADSSAAAVPPEPEAAVPAVPMGLLPMGGVPSDDQGLGREPDPDIKA